MDVLMAAGWEDRLDHAVDAFMDDLVGDIRDDAERFAARDTNFMAENIVVYKVGAKAWRIHALASYSGFVELGTRPHEIRPRDARALRWVNASGIHFASRVWHPGTTPQPFLRPALMVDRG